MATNREGGGNLDPDYDPYLHREVKKPITNFESFMHILKGCLGTGILAMPEAVKNAGMINGVISTFIFGVLCTYTLQLLITCQYALAKRLNVPFLTYPEAMKEALCMGPQCLRKCANCSPLIVDFFLVTFQLGLCCVYIVFVAVSMKTVGDLYLSNPLTTRQCILATFIPFLLINSIRNLKLLAPFSILATIITFASYGVIGYYVFKDLPSLSDRPKFTSLYTYPLFIGTTLFSLQAVGVVIAVESTMKTPKSFALIFAIGMAFVTLMYAMVGFLGYWKYGEQSKPSITLNFPPEDALAQSINILYAIAIFISYGLQGFVPVSIIWNTYVVDRLKDSKHLLAWEYLVRFCCVLVTFIFALTVPMLGLFISLFGSFCLSALGIAFPAIMDICINWPDNLGCLRWKLIKNILLIVMGTVGLLSGSYSCLSEMVIKFKSGDY